MSNIDELILLEEAGIDAAKRRIELLKKIKERQERDSWVTASDAASQLGISVRTIPVWCADGRLEGKRPGKKWLVSQSSINKHLGGFR